MLKEMESAIFLSRLPGIGAAKFRQLLDQFVEPSSALKYWRKEIEKNSRLQTHGKATTSDLVGDTLNKLRKGEVFAKFYSQSGYPESLNDLTEPPPVLFSCAEIEPQKYLGIVGARDAEPGCRDVIRSLLSEYAGSGYAVVSGGAKGVDSMAHQVALEMGIPTIAVLGSGVDVAYPKGNSQLFHQIQLAKGNIVSELLCGTKPRPGFFPTRNRIIAALSEVLFVIQAAESSGSLITAKWALKLGRRLKVKAPDNHSDPAWAGNRLLIDLGAESF